LLVLSKPTPDHYPLLDHQKKVRESEQSSLEHIKKSKVSCKGELISFQK
jgi:hypothetical protein